MGGAVIAATKELDDRMHHVQNMHGNIMTPMVAFFQLQTCKTMALRVKKQSETAMKIAQFLENLEDRKSRPSINLRSTIILKILPSFSHHWPEYLKIYDSIFACYNFNLA